MSPRISSSTALSLNVPLHFHAASAATNAPSATTVMQDSSNGRVLCTAGPPAERLHRFGSCARFATSGSAVGPVGCAGPIVELRAMPECLVVVLAARHGRGVDRVDGVVLVRVRGRRPVRAWQVGDVLVRLRIWAG